MTPQERLTAVLDEVITEEAKASRFDLEQIITDTVEWIIDCYDLGDDDEAIDDLISLTDQYFV